MEVVFWFLLAGGIGAIAVYRPRHEEVRVRTALAKRKVVKPSELAEGERGATRGTIEALDTVMRAPLSPRDCVFWRVVIDEIGVGGDFAELGRKEESVPFLVRAGRDTARVIPDRAWIAVPGQTFLSTPSRRMPGVDRLASQWARMPSYLGSTIRIIEYTFVPGDEVTVSGNVAHEADPEGAEDVSGYRTQTPSRPVLSGSRLFRLLIAR